MNKKIVCASLVPGEGLRDFTNANLFYYHKSLLKESAQVCHKLTLIAIAFIYFAGCFCLTDCHHS